MKLIYQGKNGEWINGVPARDLEAHEIQAIADSWQLSLAQTEGLLMSRGLYKAESKSAAKAAPLIKPTNDSKEEV